MDYERIAHFYDSYVRSDSDITFFLEETKKASGKILELMSGTGRVSIPLLEAGVDLTCIDSSPTMLNIFRKKLQDKGISATVIEMDVCELSLEDKFKLVFIPFHSFAEIISLSQQRRTMRRIYEHLSDGGRFICTLHNPSVRLKNVDGSKKLLGRFPIEEENGVLFLWSLENFSGEDKIVSGYQFYEIYDENGRLLSKSFLDIKFYVHDRESFESLSVDSGFQVESLYGSYSWEGFNEDTSPVMIWILLK
jgi:SAM-dependent methyltransferase